MDINLVTVGDEPVFRGMLIVSTSSISVATATGDYRDDHQCGNKHVA